MKSRFKFDTQLVVDGDRVRISVSTSFQGKLYVFDKLLSEIEIGTAKFDLIAMTIHELETEMEMHLAKISSS